MFAQAPRRRRTLRVAQSYPIRIKTATVQVEVVKNPVESISARQVSRFVEGIDGYIEHDYSSPDGKNQNDREIRQCLFEHLFIMRMIIYAQCLRSASHISDTHCACVSVTSYLMECLNLQSAHIRNKRICKIIDLMRNKSDDKQQNNLREEYHLPPMYFFVMLEVHVHNLGGGYTKYKRNNRNKIFENSA